MFCFIDYRTTEEEIKTLENQGLTCLKVPKCTSLYNAIDGHVDIQLTILDKCKKEVIIHKNMDKDFKKLLISNRIIFKETARSLNYSYPQNIILNGLVLKNYFIHNLKFTDPELIKTQNFKKLVNVKQGYTKCSCLPVKEKAIITSDYGIYNKLSKEGFDILLLPPGDIELPGLDYGFIGGTGGMISESIMAFFGSLDHYLHGKAVKNFLYKYDVTPLYLKDSKLTDRGSLLTL